MKTTMLGLSGLILLLATPSVSAQSNNASDTRLRRRSLDQYRLATCSNGNPAAYYYDSSLPVADNKVLLYLPNDDGGSCSTVAACNEKCDDFAKSCSGLSVDTLLMEDGIWSRDIRNNPFADYFKVMVPSCSSDEFSGSRDRSSDTGDVEFHGRHILASVLRDMVASFGMDRAHTIVLMGSGSGANAAARHCDFLAASVATVNNAARVRCVVDGGDFVPYWVRDVDSCHEPGNQLEAQKFLWGRVDDDGCLRKNRDKMNSTELASACGLLSRYWKDISTPLFIAANQMNVEHFSHFTCGMSKADLKYEDHVIGWRQGMLALAEAMSLEKPSNGWFIPNCDEEVASFFDDAHAKFRREVRVQLFGAKESANVMQTLHNWLTNDRHFQAIDAFGVPNAACSASKSENLDLRPDVVLPAIRDLQQGLGEGAFRQDGGFRSLFSGGTPRSRVFPPPDDLFPPQRDFSGIFDYDDLDAGGNDFDFGAPGSSRGRTRTSSVPGGGVLAITPVRNNGATPGVVARVPPTAVGVPVGVPVGVAPVQPAVNVNVVVPRPYGGGVSGGVAPVATGVVHTHGRKLSLWKKLYYLEYLRMMYNKLHKAYADEYYGTGIPVAVDAPVAVPAPAYG